MFTSTDVHRRPRLAKIAHDSKEANHLSTVPVRYHILSLEFLYCFGGEVSINMPMYRTTRPRLVYGRYYDAVSKVTCLSRGWGTDHQSLSIQNEQDKMN